MIDEIRAVLRRHEALLVHFNTPMTRHETGYPQDLQGALRNPHWRMCYSTLLKTDAGPTDPIHRVAPGNAPVCGSIGILVDLSPDTTLIRVHNTDADSNGRGHGLALGAVPSVAACEHSIASREGYNEWFLSDARPIGVFTFSDATATVREKIQLGDDVAPEEALSGYKLGRDEVAREFPDRRIFTIIDSQFHELNRQADVWKPRSYADIVPE